MAQNDDVKLHFLDYWRVVRIRWPLVLLAFLLVLLTAAIVTYFQPREYQSSVFIEVRSTAENPRIFGQGGEDCTELFAALVELEPEVQVLGPVAIPHSSTNS